MIRSYSSEDPVLEPDPALDPEGYDAICREDPTAPNCRVPLYWPAPQMVLGTHRGMHRFSWDLRYEPIGDEPRAGGGATGAVPGRTYPNVQAPWAPPGEYTVRLTVNGRRYDRPLTLHLDPRVTTPAEKLEQVAVLSRDMWERSTAVHAEYERARALVEALDAAGGEEARALKEKVEALAPESPAGGSSFRRRAPAGPPNLSTASEALMTAAMAMQEAEVGPTQRQVEACAQARRNAEGVLAAWRELSTAGLDALNAGRAAEGLPPVRAP